MVKELCGFLLINKPVGITSYDVIRYIKRIIQGRIKIGHAGTLDPFASGLMLIALGRLATKQLTTLSGADKEYCARGKLGELTDTLDLTGRLLATQDVAWVSAHDIAQAITSLGTSYIQTPPIYSALKHQGTALYALARDKKIDQHELEILVMSKRRNVTLHTCELTVCDVPMFTIKAYVSKGTYIRSLIDDIAQKIHYKGEPLRATTYELTRTRIGDFTLDQAIALNDITTRDDIEKQLIPVSYQADTLR